MDCFTSRLFHHVHLAKIQLGMCFESGAQLACSSLSECKNVFVKHYNIVVGVLSFVVIHTCTQSSEAVMNVQDLCLVDCNCFAAFNMKKSILSSAESSQSIRLTFIYFGNNFGSSLYYKIAK